jgi:30S ribosomal protein S31
LLSAVSLQKLPPICNQYFKNKKTYMGRGDKKTKKGKIFKGSFGKSRPANAPVVKKAAAVKKAK